MMNSRERSELLDFRLRSANKVTPSTQDEMLLTRLFDSTVEDIKVNSGQFMHKHLRNCRNLLEKSGEHPSPLYLTTWGVLDSQSDDFMERAKLQATKGNVRNFVLWFDMAFGARYVSLLMRNAELVVAKGPDATALQLTRLNQNLSPRRKSLEEQIEQYLSLHQLCKVSEQVLRSDPTGFTLIDELTESIKGQRNTFGSFFTLKHIVHVDDAMTRMFPLGLNFAQSAYKATYPIAREVSLEKWI